ncbi:MAG: hypothetical protein HYU30_06205 [Chloroflexi bacterium]|nr:hypothetical protein [Chloroflexota bacterium]
MCCVRVPKVRSRTEESVVFRPRLVPPYVRRAKRMDAALVVSMIVFVGLSGSVGFGALILFLFSLGMGIPLVIAATAMAKVLPLLFRMEKVIPWMGLAASLLMAGFAVLLITGQYMVLTEWVYRLLPAPVAR